jgi:hypothetical protein
VKFAGLRAADVSRGLDALDGQLLRFRDEQGREPFDLQRAPRPGAGSLAPVRFLPKWDALLLSHADRTRILPPEYHPAVIKACYVFSLPSSSAGWSPASGRQSGGG